MNKAEFIEKLSARLTGQLSTAEVLDQLRFYESYIDGEIAKGQREEDVVAALGDPLLIAKTIVDTPHEERPFAEAEENSYTDPFANQFGTQNTPIQSAGNSIAQMFRAPDGSFNWGCIAGLLVALLLVFGSLYLAVRVIHNFWPVILAFFIVYMIFRKEK